MKIFYLISVLIRKIRGKYPLTQEYIKRGLIVGENFNRQEGVSLDYGHCYKIKIGNNVTLAPKVTLLAHDASTKQFLGYTKVGLVEIGNNVFIGANSTVLPGVKIGDNVIIGAGSIVSKDIPNNCVALGSPASKVLDISTYLEKHRKNIDKGLVFNKEYSDLNIKIDKDKMEYILSKLKYNKIMYMV